MILVVIDSKRNKWQLKQRLPGNLFAYDYSYLFYDLNFFPQLGYRYPPLVESVMYTTCFYKRPNWVCCYPPSPKNPACFHFYEKRRKVKIASSVCFAVSELFKGPHTPQAARMHRQTPSPGTTWSIPAATALNCACEHLCFISIYFVPLVARCVLR